MSDFQPRGLTPDFLGAAAKINTAFTQKGRAITQPEGRVEVSQTGRDIKVWVPQYINRRGDPIIVNEISTTIVRDSRDPKQIAAIKVTDFDRTIEIREGYVSETIKFQPSPFLVEFFGAAELRATQIWGNPQTPDSGNDLVGAIIEFEKPQVVKERGAGNESPAATVTYKKVQDGDLFLRSLGNTFKHSYVERALKEAFYRDAIRVLEELPFNDQLFGALSRAAVSGRAVSFGNELDLTGLKPESQIPDILLREAMRKSGLVQFSQEIRR